MVSHVNHMYHLINHCQICYHDFQVSGERQSTNMIKHMIQRFKYLECQAFKVKNHLVSNTSKDCWYVESHVSFASSNYESHVSSHLCFDFRQKPEKHGTYPDHWLTQANLIIKEFQGENLKEKW